MRATSSTRSVLCVISGLQLGTITSKPPSTVATTQPISFRVFVISSAVYSTPVSSDAKVEDRKTVAGLAELSTKVPNESALAPASSSRSAIALAAANSATFGSTPLSNLLEASLGSLWRRADRAIETPSKFAASIRTEAVLSLTSVLSPPITPARPIAAELSAITRSSACKVLTWPSSVFRVSPFFALLTVIEPLSFEAS